MFKTLRSYLLVTLAAAFVGATAPAADQAETSRVTWWVAADPHVGHGSEQYPGQHISRAVADVNQLGIADKAILLGDLVEDSSAMGEILREEMAKLDAEWTYVLGNHDFDQVTGEPALPPRFEARTVQGIRFISLSDEVPGHRVEAPGHDVDRNLVMSTAQEEWFWNELATHRESRTPIFLFTHQPHPEFAAWNRLRDELEDYHVVAWFSGHKHRWDIRPDSRAGFIQVNIHSIGGVREDYLSSFLELDRQGDTVEVTVRFRNHDTREWIRVDGQDRLTFRVELPRD